MMTSRQSAFRIQVLVSAGLLLPLLVGQGCPAPTPSQLTVDAGSAMSVPAGQAIVLQATVTGGSGVYSYAWTPSTGLDNPTALRPTFTAAATTTFTLTATDSLGATASDSVTITVNPPSDGSNNNPPPSGTNLAVNAGADQATTVGSAVTVTATPSGGTAPYTYLWSGSGNFSSPTAATTQFTPISAGQLTLTVLVTDAAGSTATDTLVVTASTQAVLSTLTWAANYGGGGYEAVAFFSRSLNKASAETPGNYRISGVNTPATTATLGSDLRTVVLVFNKPLSAAARLDVGVGGGLRDSLGGMVEPSVNRPITASSSDVAGPFTASRVWGNGRDAYRVIVEFSEAMDRASAEVLANYTLAGIPPTAVALDDTGKVLTLDFATTAAGFRLTDTLTISANVRDINGRPTVSTAPAGMNANPADATGPTAPSSGWLWGVDGSTYFVTATFNEVMDKTSAEVLGSYAIGSNQPSSALLSASGRTVTLTFDATAGGLNRTDTLSIAPTVLDINGRANTTVAPGTIQPNPIDITGPIAATRTWGRNASAYTVIVTFTEAMDAAAATTLANYTLSTPSDAGGSATWQPATAVLDGAGKVVTLTFPTVGVGLTRSDTLTIARAVVDINGHENVGAESAAIGTNTTDITSPLATSALWKADQGQYAVELAFDEVMDRSSAVTLQNYELHRSTDGGVYRPTQAVLDTAGRLVTLTFGTTYTSTDATLGGFNADDRLVIRPIVLDINGRGTTSTAAARVRANPADVTAPVARRATVLRQDDGNGNMLATSVEVVFSEVVDKRTAEAAAYAIGGGVTVTSASLLADGVTVRLGISADPATQSVTVPTTVTDINGVAVQAATKPVLEVMTVDAGPDLQLTLGQTTELGVAVTGGAAPYTYAWTPVDRLIGADTATPDFEPNAAGLFTLTVTVTDSEGRQATDAVVVDVAP